jgi:hypothetical protein
LPFHCDPGSVIHRYPLDEVQISVDNQHY